LIPSEIGLLTFTAGKAIFACGACACAGCFRFVGLAAGFAFGVIFISCACKLSFIHSCPSPHPILTKDIFFILS
jgi:hypothetical protein